MEQIENNENKSNPLPTVTRLIATLSPFLLVILGAILSPLVTYLDGEYFTKDSILSSISIEILANQQAIYGIPGGVQGYLNNVETSRPDIPAWNLGVQNTVFNSYIPQMDLLDNVTRSDIDELYDQFQGVDSNCELLQQVSKDYYSKLPFASKAFVINSGNQCIMAATLASEEADIVLAEIAVTDKVNTPGLINEDYINTIRPNVATYLQSLSVGSTTTLDYVMSIAGDTNQEGEGFATAVSLLRLGTKIHQPINLLEFQK